jgi:hypothetical protein
VFLNLDRAMIGRFLGSRDLGVYLLAFGLANMPVTIITGVLGRVAFSAFSQLEREGREVRTAYLRILALLVGLAVARPHRLGRASPSSAVCSPAARRRCSRSSPRTGSSADSVG